MRLVSLDLYTGFIVLGGIGVIVKISLRVNIL